MADITLPVIDVTFKKLATSFIKRGQKGVVAIVVKDDTIATDKTILYTSIEQLIKDKATFEISNYNAIFDVFLGNVSKVYVVKVGKTKTVADIIDKLNLIQPNWVTLIAGQPADYTALITWEKAQNLIRQRAFKLVVFKAAIADSCHTVNFSTDKVKRISDTAEITGDLYLGRIAGMLAGLPTSMSTTYFKLTDLAYVSNTVDVNAELAKGKFVLINDDDDVLVARGITSLVTVTGDITEDYKHIAFVEVIDQIREDVKRTFKSDFIGKFKNISSNQSLFISAVNTYYIELALEGILDPEFNNYAYIDAETMRIKLAAMGKDVTGLSDGQVIKLTIGQDLYAASQIKVSGTIESLGLIVNLN